MVTLWPAHVRWGGTLGTTADDGHIIFHKVPIVMHGTAEVLGAAFFCPVGPTVSVSAEGWDGMGWDGIRWDLSVAL